MCTSCQEIQNVSEFSSYIQVVVSGPQANVNIMTKYSESLQLLIYSRYCFVFCSYKFVNPMLNIYFKSFIFERHIIHNLINNSYSYEITCIGYEISLLFNSLYCKHITKPNLLDSSLPIEDKITFLHEQRVFLPIQLAQKVAMFELFLN